MAAVPVVSQALRLLRAGGPLSRAFCRGSLLTGWLFLSGIACSAGPELREVIVSHSDESGTLQLYRMNEDGSESRQLTLGTLGCVQPACSPDGQNIVYLKRSKKGMAVWLCDTDGKGARELIPSGGNLLPSWFPDSKHIIWMKFRLGPKRQDPARDSQIHVMNIETGESRRLFSDKGQMQFSNAMPVVSPDGTQVAFVSNRSGFFRVWGE